MKALKRARFLVVCLRKEAERLSVESLGAKVKGIAGARFIVDMPKHYAASSLFDRADRLEARIEAIGKL